MIKSIEIGDRIYSAQFWIDLGLPEYLHHCFDGTRLLYLESGRVGKAGSEALRAIFNHHEREEIRGAWLRLEKMYCNIPGMRPALFLHEIASNLEWANHTSPIEKMTLAQWQKLKAQARKAVDELTYVSNQIDDDWNKQCPKRLLFELVSAKYRSLSDEDLNKEASLKAMSDVANCQVSCAEASIEVSLIDLLEKWYEEHIENSFHRPFGGRPGRGDFGKRRFCQDLSRMIFLRVGNFAYGEVAIFASAIFGLTDEDYVRKVIDRNEDKKKLADVKEQQ